jgi:hypothetical protein
MPAFRQAPRADGQGQAGVLKVPDEGQVHGLGGEQGENSDFHRGADVLPGVEAGGEHLHQDHSDQGPTA